jgi:hypothetical protein
VRRYPATVRLHLEHVIDAALDDVERASIDPEFEARLTALPNVHERSVLTRDEREDGSIHRVVRYRFSGPLPAPVLKAIGGGVIGWDEEGTYDPDEHGWRFEIHPHVMQGRFTCTGRYAFEATGQDSTKRIVDAEVKVRIPLFGGRVEKVIAEGLRETMNAEAELLEAYVNA